MTKNYDCKALSDCFAIVVPLCPPTNYRKKILYSGIRQKLFLSLSRLIPMHFLAHSNRMTERTRGDILS